MERSEIRGGRFNCKFAPVLRLLVLPDRLHIVMTLPMDDADFSNRISLIKRQFTTALVRTGVRIPHHPNGVRALWQRRFWQHTIRDEKDFARHVDYIHFNSVKHGSSRACATGRILHFTIVSGVK